MPPKQTLGKASSLSPFMNPLSISYFKVECFNPEEMRTRGAFMPKVVSHGSFQPRAPGFNSLLCDFLHSLIILKFWEPQFSYL